LVAGLGSGWTETEFRMTGIAFPDVTTRLRMLDEALACIRGLWGGAPFSFAGEFYRFQDAVLFPKPVQRPHPPFLLGGNGRGLLRLAAKHADELNIVSGTGSASAGRASGTSRSPSSPTGATTCCGGSGRKCCRGCRWAPPRRRARCRAHHPVLLNLDSERDRWLATISSRSRARSPRRSPAGT